MKNSIYLFLILINVSVYSQKSSDTLVIKYDSRKSIMQKPKSFFTHPKLKSNDSLSFIYSIRINSDSFSLAFSHYNVADFMLAKSQNIISYDYPLKKLIDIETLENLTIIDYNFFEKYNYKYLVDIFQGKDKRSNEDNPFIWLYDVNKCINGKVLLKQVHHVWYNGE